MTVKNLINRARELWRVIRAEHNEKANTAERVGYAGLAILDALEHSTPVIGVNGNWWIGGADTGVSAQGAPGINGKNTPINCYFTKQGINGEVFPSVFRWIEDLKVSSVLLMSDSTGFTCEISGTQYDQNTIIGAALPAGTELRLLDINIRAGNNVGNVLILHCVPNGTRNDRKNIFLPTFCA